ncbi:hypothetical protein LSH36_97g07056 [Paralvinella palmiformis]|uniref:Uncharacterized protein n=1 Tax=Paralvinella palmiformis TaxID=53620 RepID=A0AAD9K085_9ANNE|nr:hypothetical protein LSH36_97g07056 [Paralvinella palmiformis]
MVHKKLKDGSAKKKFGHMLQAQGVDKSLVKNLLKTHSNYDHLWHILPPAHLFTYLTVEESGFVHRIDVAVCYDAMFELLGSEGGASTAGGMELMTSVGSYLNRGELWAKIHHHSKMDDEQLSRLKNAITLKLEPPLIDMVLDIQEITV